MSERNTDPGPKPVEDLIRTALRGEGFLVPETEEELKRFEDEHARNPVEVPAHLLNPEWLFRAAEPTSSVTSTPPAENHAVAARDGKQRTPEVAARMREDRAAADPQVAGRGSQPAGDGVQPQFATSTRLREIAELAEWVSGEFGTKGSIDPEAIAVRAAIGVSFNDYDDAFDGLLEHAAGQFHIYCNLRRVEARASDRARFTLAHELGHYFIDLHRQKLERGESLPLSQCEYESAQPIEREADSFAAHLLMPASRFVRCTRGLLPGLPGVLSLRRHFGTSVTSTACRYAELGIAPCVVVKWSSGGVGWRFLGPAAWEARLGRTIQSAADLPPGSATARALACETPPAGGFFETGTTVASWFSSVSHGNFRNAVLVEQAMSLGRFGAITMLYPAMDGFTTLA